MLLTFTICVIVRFFLVLLAKYVSETILQIMGYIALYQGVVFISIYLTDSRKTGIEVGGKKIWWNKFRPLHGVLYLLFAIYAIKKESNSWIVLLLDILLGIVLYIINYYFKS